MRIGTSILVRVSLALIFAAHHARRCVVRIAGYKGVRTVRILLIRDGRVLLVRHWYAPAVLMLPGGGIKNSESPKDAAIREVKEETGFDVRNLELLGEYEGNYEGDSVTVFYTSEFDGYIRLIPDREIMLRSFRSLTEVEQSEDIAPDHKKRIIAFNAGIRAERGTW